MTHTTSGIAALPASPVSDPAHAWLVDLVARHDVSPSQRRVVQYMLGSLHEAAFASSVEVANSAGVSQPTVTRLAAALGYMSYPSLRKALRNAVLTGSDALVSAEPRIGLSGEHQSLTVLEDTLASDAMSAASRVLTETTPLGVVGFRASGALARYFGYFGQRILPDVQILDDSATVRDRLLQLRTSGAAAALFVVMPRYPKVTIEALAFARELGLTTVAIVDRVFVPFADLIDIQLVAPVSTELVFDSHASAVVLEIALLDAISKLNPERTQARLEGHEDLVAGWAYPTSKS